ncbi:hypothetical protein WN943_025613 [Citrus x changshan-huyou]
MFCCAVKFVRENVVLSSGDTGAMVKLPWYMHICYLAMFNFGNDLAYYDLKIHGLNLLSNIKNEVANNVLGYFEFFLFL